MKRRIKKPGLPGELTRSEIELVWNPLFSKMLEVFTKESGLDYHSRKLRYAADGSMTFTFRANAPVESSTKEVTQELIDAGLAPANTIIWADWDQQDYWLAKILRSTGRGRYVIQFLDDGTTWRYRCNTLKIKNPVTGEKSFV